MKKVLNFMVLVVSALILQCCSTDDPISDIYNGNGYNGGMNNNSGNNSSMGSELLTFSVEIDRTTPEPSMTVAE